MNRIVLLFIVSFTFLPIKVSAQCSSSHVTFFPKSETLQQNSLIVIEGNGMAQKVINELTFFHPIYLQSGSHKVNLKLEEIRSGQKDETQILLRPEIELVVGGRYELKVGDLEEDEKIFFEGKDESGNNYAISWIVTENSNTQPFEWKNKSKFLQFVYKKEAEEDCVVNSYAMFEIDIDSPGEVLVNTEVIDMETNERFEYYLQLNENRLLVGNGIGDGAIVLQENHNYKLRFDVFNTAERPKGNWSDWVSFKVPEYSKPPPPMRGCLPEHLHLIE